MRESERRREREREVSKEEERAESRSGRRRRLSFVVCSHVKSVPEALHTINLESCDSVGTISDAIPKVNLFIYPEVKQVIL